MIDLSALRGGLIVSCQARPDNPLHGPVHMAAAAIAAENAGAVGIRAEGVADISAIRAAVRLPILGIRKILDGRPVYITPTFETAAEIVAAGADIVAIDATLRERPDGTTAADLIARIRLQLGVPVMADIDCVEAAETAVRAGADLIATTLSGYTGATVPTDPDLELITVLKNTVDVPILAEGRLWTPDDVRDAFAAGAYAVVVGTAITNPGRITERFVRATPGDTNA